jgi:uncharacterized protein YqjF (DUF2071 family)
VRETSEVEGKQEIPLMAVARSFLTAQWRNLVMLNYAIDPELLRDHVPKGTEIDIWNGRTFVSLVGFQFLDTRLLGIGIPFHRNFPEVNLRFYVRHHAVDDWHRGVVFIKEIVPRSAVSLVARWVYNEQYVTLPMRNSVELPSADNDQRGSIGYSWKWAGTWCQLSATMHGEPSPLAPGSEEEFITEHYWGYSSQRDGSTLEYAVEHPSWRVWKADESRFEGNIGTLYGSEFANVLAGQPSSAFVAEGSEIVVRQGRPTRIR